MPKRIIFIFIFFVFGCSPGLDKKTNEALENFKYEKTASPMAPGINPGLLSGIRDKNFIDKIKNKVYPYFLSGEFGNFSGADNKKISFVVFRNPGNTGSIVILTGAFESCIKYAELAYDLRDTGFSLYIFDHRGMGFSERLLPDAQKLYVKDFDDYLTDIKVFVEKIVKPGRPEKLFILGHSLGGLEALRYIEEYPADFNGAILSSPLVDMNTGSFPKWLAGLFSSMNVFFGRGQAFAPGQDYRIVPEFEKNLNSRDFPRWFLWEKYYVPENPSIALGGATFNWIRVCLDAGNTALRKADKVRIPVLFLQAGDDRIVNPGGMNEAALRIKGCKKVLFGGSYHEILMEKDDVRNKALDEIKAFIRTQ